MCVYSMIADHKITEWQRRRPSIPPIDWPDTVTLPSTGTVKVPLITQAEIDEFRRLLDRARQYDREHGQPDCELDEKRRALQTLAKELGVEITFP